MKKYILLSIFALLSFYASAQKYTISGFVENSISGEKLPGASITVKESTMLSTISDEKAFYSLTLPPMEYHIVCSYKGYQTQTFECNLTKDTVVNFVLLLSKQFQDPEEKPRPEDPQMSKHSISMDMIKRIPLLLNENDVIKTIQLLPGIQYGKEGTNGIYVRGGSGDQNMILIDGVPVYNIGHLAGISSIFNEDVANNVLLIKGAFPARYGGSLSSVIDIKTKEGNDKKIGGAFSFGLLSSKLTLEGPIVKDKTSFIISYRRTWLDFLTNPLISYISKKYREDESFGGGFYFWDFNAKIAHKLSRKDRLYLSIYTGKDKYSFVNEKNTGNNIVKADYSMLMRNLTSSLRWNHLFGKKLFSNLTIAYTKYKFTTSIIDEKNNNAQNFIDYRKWDYESGINDFTTKLDFDYSASRSHNLKFGFRYIYHTFFPGENVLDIKSDQEAVNDSTFAYSNLYSSEYAIYLQDEIRIGEKLVANIGLHYSGFYEDDTLFHSLQPRISARLLLSRNFSVKAAFCRMSQYLHVLTNYSIGMPTDLWLPVTKKILPQKSNQYTLGFYYSTKKGVDFSVEGYYKTMDNLIEYKNGASFFNLGENFDSDPRAWEKNIEKDGKGESFGFEFLIKKNIGKTTGWFAYTWSKAWRKFDNINFGKKFPYKYDRRHDISIVLLQELGKKFNVGINWILGTGNPITLALSRYETLSDNPGNTVPDVEYRNNYRMPVYHRLDLAFNFPKQKKRGKRTWSINIYNVYNRRNAYFLMSKEENGLEVFKQYSILPIIPSFSYKFEF